jgi:hypothetical protein
MLAPLQNDGFDCRHHAAAAPHGHNSDRAILPAKGFPVRHMAQQHFLNGAQ